MLAGLGRPGRMLEIEEGTMRRILNDLLSREVRLSSLFTSALSHMQEDHPGFCLPPVILV